MVSALKNGEFYGKRLYLEIAVEGKDYASQDNDRVNVKKNRAERRRAERDTSIGEADVPWKSKRSGKKRPHNKRGNNADADLPFAMFRKKGKRKK